MLSPRILNLKAMKSGQEEGALSQQPRYFLHLALQKGLGSHPPPKFGFQATLSLKLGCPSKKFLYAENGQSLSLTGSLDFD